VISEPLRARIDTFFVAQPRIAAAYLFGSRATGRSRRGSDFDLALVVRERLDGWEQVELETSLSEVVGADGDLVVFGEASPLLQHQILKWGTLLYEADHPERVRQEVAARREYLDTRHLHRELRV
jgi:predicted nucleotidyltransferase